jgi:diguanylate cyclase (GGDEF)-like protein/PAS domain S-box-containing protein
MVHTTTYGCHGQKEWRLVPWKSAEPLEDLVSTAWWLKPEPLSCACSERFTDAPVSLMPVLAREYERVASLRALGILDTDVDADLDALVQAAATELDMPIARLNLVDAEREWTKSAVGYPTGISTPRNVAFCAYTVLNPHSVTVVGDAALDRRFSANPLVTGSLGIRFYAGAPLTDASGRVLGALSVMDKRPRDFGPAREARLFELACLVSAALEAGRPGPARLASEEHYRNAYDLNPHAPWIALPDGAIEQASPRWLELTGMSQEQARGTGWTHAVHPDDLPGTLEQWRACLTSGEPLNREYRLLMRDGSYCWFRGRAAAKRGLDGAIIRWYGTLEDIHQQKMADAALQQSEQRLRSALDLGGVGAWEYDAAGGGVTASDLCAQAFGLRSGGELPDYPTVLALLHPDDRRVLDHERHLVVSGNYQMDVELRTIWPGGGLHWVRLTGRAALGADGRPKAFGLAVDVTERRQAKEARERNQARLMHLVNYDALTDLANRRLLDTRLADALAALPPGRKAAILCVDLDDFKATNESLGQDTGDWLLCQVANRLVACAGAGSTVARTGGDEFAILADTADTAEAVRLAERLLLAVMEPFAMDGGTALLGGSIGVSIAPNDGTAPDLLLKNAYAALHRAKASGRGTYRLYEADMDERLHLRKALRAGFQDALEAEQLRLFYQPLVDLTTGRVTAFEALMRWQHPQRGLVMPDEFIPIAEETGWINRFGRWGLRQACLQAASWPDSVCVAVNLSVLQFTTGDLQAHVAEALAASGLAASRLELEVTESLLLHESQANIATLEALRRMGAKLVMDDFGAGYSSLVYLRRFHFDKLKIDKSLIMGLPDADGGDAIVAAIFALGRSLGIDVTAEGIESTAQLALLRQNGCAQGQGYLFTPPVPPEQVAGLLSRSWPAA